ncbi:hypothetical protein QN277_002695 [Acacia crassicarpa]|uniref:Retrotransposon gag domain-containing protein n=1 Tax=Acacia crassicarpa TaxID=499986 RepID=A0AAE1NBJ1_9FABA|nr:hypothetical protein QN277_002695 [Acacia crassicarpa]
MARKHHHRPSPSSPEFSISSPVAAAAGGKPRRSILRKKKTEDDDDDYSDDASASQSLYDESQGDEYEPFEKDVDIESFSDAHDDPSPSQKPTKYIPDQSNKNIQGKSSSMSASNLLNLSHPTMTCYKKIAPLPIFCGTPTECPIAHLSRFNKVCRANGGSSIDMFMRIFPVTLEEEAALWYDLNIEPYPNLTWEEIKSSFLEAYRRIEVMEELKSEVMRINQGESESVRTYFLRLQWILQRWPEHGLSEALLKGVFIDGLRTEFQEWILLQKPNSLNDALRLAFSYEEMRSIRSRKELVECCGFCEGMHEERECQVREAMRGLWRESQEREKEKDFVRSISMGPRSDDHEKVEEASTKKKKNQCQCIKHQCSSKRLLRNMSSVSGTSCPDAA